MAKTNGRPTETPTLHGSYWEQRCRESQAAFDELEEHLQTRDEMQRRFDELDSTCIELARDYRVLADAGSPKAEPAYTRLREARMARDSVRREWMSETDRLRAAVMAFTDPELSGLRRAVAERNRVLWRGLDVQFTDEQKFVDGTSRIVVRDNFSGIGDAIRRQLEFVKEADRLRERPLSDLLDLVRESGRHFTETRDFGENMMVERAVPESQFREMRGAVTEATAGFDPLNAERGRFWSGPF